jgi:drug/metabolite transporter (DMT)-like permease
MLGEILTIVAALCWAIGASLYKKSLLNVRPVTLNLFRSFPATIYAFLVLYLLGKWTLLSELTVVSLAYIGIASLLVLAVGDTLYLVGLEITQANVAAPLASTTPLFAVIIAILFLKEEISRRVLVGVFL